MDHTSDLGNAELFDHEWHRARVNLLTTAAWLKEQVNQFLKPYGLTQQQFNILRILRGAAPDPISTSDLRDRMIDKMSDTSRLTDRLASKGLLRKKDCPHDGRKVNIWITEQGIRVLQSIDQNMNQLDDLTRGLTAEESQQLNYLLNKLRHE